MHLSYNPDGVPLLLSLFQQDFLGLVQAELQGVQFAGVFLGGAHVVPQLPAAFLPAQTAEGARASRVDTTATAAALPGLLSALGLRMQDRVQKLQVLNESEIDRDRER